MFQIAFLRIVFALIVYGVISVGILIGLALCKAGKDN
jgi:hypothetical protein